VFDYEQMTRYDLVLQVEDNSPISRRQSSPSSVFINIVNLDDEPTLFNQTTYRESVQCWLNKWLDYNIQ